MKSIKFYLFIGLVGGCIQQTTLAATNDCQVSSPTAVAKPFRHLEMGAPFHPTDLKSFKALPGCELDRVGVVSCSATGSLGELYVIFEGRVVRVDIEVSDAAFCLCEFAGLETQRTVEEVKRWVKNRSLEIVDGHPRDAPELYTVLALEFSTRWCRKGCYAAFNFADSHLESIRILTDEPNL